MSSKISYEEYVKYSRGIEQYYYLFYKIWELGTPTITEEVETAAVGFDEFGDNCRFLFNGGFWEKCSEYERLFVICHECLHVLLNHGKRILFLKKEYKDVANIALDVVVNELLVNKFKFDRNKISFQNDLCFADTVFKDNNTVSKDESFEYYFNRIKKENVKIYLTTLDDHSFMEKNSEKIDKFLSNIGDSLSSETLNQFQESFSQHFGNLQQDENGNLISSEEESDRGDMSGNSWIVIKPEVVKKKKKWESIIKKWSKKFNKSNDKDAEQWARINRRLISISSDLIIPSDMEVDDKQEGKISVWFFQDTSGSCVRLAPRFFKAAKTLPENRFDVKLFCFDTRVYETSLESGKLYGFGGTRFDIISDYVNKEEKYPEAIFVITDGYGNIPKIAEKLQNKWYWFLSTSCTHYIPKKCNVYKLSEFE